MKISIEMIISIDNEMKISKKMIDLKKNHTCYGQKKYNNSHKTFRVSTQNTARGLFCTSHLLW